MNFLKEIVRRIFWCCLTASFFLGCDRGDGAEVGSQEPVTTAAAVENEPVTGEAAPEAVQSTVEGLCVENDSCDEGDNCICSYSPSGLLLTKSVDRGSDGDVNHTESYTYDEQGNQLTAELIILVQGVPMQHLVLAYEYDEWGNRTSVEVQDGQGQVRSRQDVYYDAQHNRLRVDVDEGADGTVDTQMTYDPPCPPEIHRDRFRYNLCDRPELW